MFRSLMMMMIRLIGERLMVFQDWDCMRLEQYLANSCFLYKWVTNHHHHYHHWSVSSLFPLFIPSFLSSFSPSFPPPLTPITFFTRALIFTTVGGVRVGQFEPVSESLHLIHGQHTFCTHHFLSLSLSLINRSIVFLVLSLTYWLTGWLASWLAGLLACLARSPSQTLIIT